jgi:uncharacterized membrane protein
MHFPLLRALLALAAALLPSTRAHAQASATLTPITGTTTMFQPAASLANLDAGELVAGSTLWQFESIVYVETHVGFLWSPALGPDVFEVPASVYFDDNFQFPADISDEGTVVGTDAFMRTFRARPFVWTASRGFRFLPSSPEAADGEANAVSRDGRTIGGAVQRGFFSSPRAALWRDGRLTVLGPADGSSRGNDLSGDGSILVGELGRGFASVHAMRWSNGLPLPLEPLAGEDSSSALHVSLDGTSALGIASIAGTNVLVSWDAAGVATRHDPPAGSTVESIRAISPDAGAAVGALSTNGNQAPYLWTAAGGFTVLDELGREDDYDLSEAHDVSDDGTEVVGALNASVVSNGDPPPIGFLWTAATGTQDLELLVQAAGLPPRGIFDAFGISGDGEVIAATGTVRPTIHDTTSILIDFASSSIRGVRVR